MAGTDKLLWDVGGRPLIAWTLEALLAASSVERLVLVTSADRVPGWTAADWLPAGVTAVVAGGASRQASVAAGVRHLDVLDGGDGTGRERPVLVHDGARPLVPPSLVDEVAAAVEAHGAALPVLPVAETLKRVVDGVVETTVTRSSLAAAQTPQGARRGLLLDAWATFPPEGPPEFTDEAALLEACKLVVHAIPGAPANLKVTLPDDLRRVEATLAPVGARVGFGSDSHPFGPGTGLRLGGIELAGAPRLAGHSDGDVVLHAVADALLGAAGQGDLGRLFPADASTPKGIASAELLAEVRRRLAAAGLAAASVDVTVVAARPRLGARLDEMRDAIAALLGLAPDAVNVKASTGNLSGDEGAGRSISAQVIATVGPAS
jgi:2-C-methyl-D-erythritol 4-phosphate cytidylyltransferase/2-C-methyl-D-erythritol 2,4-cyclodiphosphate synthase